MSMVTPFGIIVVIEVDRVDGAVTVIIAESVDGEVNSNRRAPRAAACKSLSWLLITIMLAKVWWHPVHFS